jgi:hypothetical protein
VFVQSLFFKFTNSPETQYIFGTLDAWGARSARRGCSRPNGIFSQYVVGTGELIASILLLAGLSNGSACFVRSAPQWRSASSRARSSSTCSRRSACLC